MEFASILITLIAVAFSFAAGVQAIPRPTAEPTGYIRPVR